MNNQGKAIKLPKEVDYFKYDNNTELLKHWIESFDDKFDDVIEVKEEGIQIKTKEGHSLTVKSPYIILRGSINEYWPVDMNAFKNTYQIL